VMMIDESSLRVRFEALRPSLDRSFHFSIV
jgi:hypothetical protein